MNKLESSIQGDIIKYLEARGHIAVRVARSNKSGIPDLIVCLRPSGRFVGIEVKRPEDNNPSALQTRQLRRITAAGGLAIIATGVEDVRKLLTSLPDRIE